MDKSGTQTSDRGRTARLTLLAAVSGICSIANVPANAVEIGELNIQSKLGQSLRASISYALNANEQIHDYCIFLRSGAPTDGIPTLTRARLQITDTAIVVTGRTPIREPMLTMQLEVNCPYTPRLSRFFTLLVNPAQDGFNQVAAQQAGSISAAAPAVTGNLATRPPATDPVSDRETSVPVTSITSSTSYQVQPGDTLSGIASRIEGRTLALAPFVEAIFTANPEAFIDGDKNLLKAGSWLNIPNATGVLAVAPFESVDQPDMYGAAQPAPDNSARNNPTTATGLDAYTGFSAAATSDPDTQSYDSGFEDQSGAEPTIEAPMFPDEDYGELAAEEEVSNASPATNAPVDAVDDLRPGDVIVADSSTAAETIEAAAAAPVSAAAPATAPTAQNIPVVSGAPPESSGSAWSWLLWIGGASVGFLIGFGLFSKRIRERFGNAPSPVAQPVDAGLDDTSIDLTASQIVVPDVDFQFDDTPAAQPEIALDADLGDGSGLQGSTDIDVAQDFGFSAEDDLASEMDLELPAMAATEEEQPSTDIIPPNRIEEPTILDSEVPPSEDGDGDGTEYDLSMIVDATKQRIGETEQTARDLMAVQVDSSADVAADIDSLTLNEEIDLQALEQDYEEELSATQALNVEIARAAIEIAEQMEDTTDSQLDDDAPTGNYAEIPLDLSAELPGSLGLDLDLDVTAELTGNVAVLDDAENDELGNADATEIADIDATEIADLDDTTINEALPDEIQALALEPTVEMEVESGRVNTKKGTG